MFNKRIIKKGFILFIVAIMFFTLVGCENSSESQEINSSNVINELKNDRDKFKIKTLIDGFWFATSEYNDENDSITLDYDEEFGFVFKKCQEENFDGIALTSYQKSWKYTINEKKTINIFRYYSKQNQYKLMFFGTYSKAWDAITLTFTEDAKEYYDLITSDTATVILSHFKDNVEHNNVLKKLIFETWSTVDYDESKNPTNGFDSNSTQNDLRKSLLTIDPAVELFTFYYNNKEFDMSEGNAKITSYDEKDGWQYKAQYYYFDSDSNSIILRPYRSKENDTPFMYSFDKELKELKLTNHGQDVTVYRITNFTE